MDFVREQIQTKMEQGALPRTPPQKVSVEYGSGGVCEGCDAEIRDGEVMHEAVLPGGRALSFHGACELTWRALIAAFLARIYYGL
jgi:hypothetical protein